MNPYEDKFLSGIDNSIAKKKSDILFDSFTLDILKQKIEQEQKNKRPSLKSFKDIYTEEEIQKDIAYTKKLKDDNEGYANESEKTKKLAADVFEGIVIDESVKSAWLGTRVTMTPTSLYDDYINHVDAIAEFAFEKEGIQHLGLAMDITFNKNEGQLEKKLGRIEENIKNGKAPAFVKYFENSQGEHKKMFVPKIIIGADADTLRDLVRLWKDKHSKDERVWKQAEHELNFHSFQTKMLMGAHAQLQAFEEFARKNNETKTEKSYFIAKKIIENVINEKTLFNEQKDSLAVKKDEVLSYILAYSKDLSKK